MAGKDIEAPFVLVSAALAEPVDAVETRPFGPWADTAPTAFDGALPLGIYLSDADAARLAADAQMGALVRAAGVPTEQGCAGGLAGFCLRAMAARLGLLASAAADERQAAAALRQAHMQLQENFAATEDFLWRALSPRFAQVSHWPDDGAVLDLPPGGQLRQRLASGGRGLVAVDVMAAGGKGVRACLQYCDGEMAATWIEPLTPAEGPQTRVQRYCWPRGLQEPDADIWLVLENTGPDSDPDFGADYGPTTARLALAAPTPLPEFALHQGRPLALTLWAGLPGVRLPRMGLRDAGPGGDQGGVPGGGLAQRVLAPATLGAPVLIGARGRAQYLEATETIELRPGHGECTACLPGLVPGGAVQAVFHVQNTGLRPFHARVGALASAQSLPEAGNAALALVPLVWLPVSLPVRLEAALPAGAGKVDLILKVENAGPGDCLSLWAVTLRGPSRA